MEAIIVRYDKWCKLCAHAEKKENDEPCNACLFQSYNEESEKPIMWKEKSEEGKK